MNAPVTTTLPARSAYLASIDGLRALAVTVVIINHFNANLLPSGYLGVDVFFVISGFVIARSLLQRSEASLGSALLQFYARRVRRLAPALILVTIVSFLLIRLFDPNPVRSVVVGAASLGGVSNLVLYLQAADYFGPNIRFDPFIHTWSLGVEEQFYLIIPAGLLLLRADGQRSARVVAVIAVLALLSLAGFVLVYPHNEPAAYYLIPFRFWQLAAGVLLAVACERGWVQQGPGPLRSLSADWAVPALVAVFLLPTSLAVIATILASGVAAWALLQVWRHDGNERLLGNAAARRVGLWSYSLYLWHWPVICLSRWTLGVSAWTAPFQVALMLALAAATYRWVEVPLRRRQWFSTSARTVGVGLAVLGATAGVILLAERAGWPPFTGSRAELSASGQGIEPGYRAEYSHRLVDDCAIERVWSPDPTIRQSRLAACTAGPANAPVTLIVMGDSHALDLFPASDWIAHRGLARVTNLYGAACQVPATSAGGRCDLGAKLLAALPPASNSHSAVVIRNNYAPRRIDGSLARYGAALDRAVALLTARGYRVFYFGPAPKYYQVGAGSPCTEQWYRPKWAISATCRAGLSESRAEQLARGAEWARQLAELERRRSGFTVLDPFPLLCGDDPRRCVPWRDGQPLYRDDSHLTLSGSRLMVAPLLEAVRQVARPPR